MSMSPSAFTFKLTVPNDPALAEMVAEMARHAAEYAQLNGDAAADFAERARGAAVKALKAAQGHNCLAVFAAAGGTLSITIGGETVSQPLS
jgi:hypothetical protein